MYWERVKTESVKFVAYEGWDEFSKYTAYPDQNTAAHYLHIGRRNSPSALAYGSSDAIILLMRGGGVWRICESFNMYSPWMHVADAKTLKEAKAKARRRV